MGAVGLLNEKKPTRYALRSTALADVIGKAVHILRTTLGMAAKIEIRLLAIADVVAVIARRAGAGTLLVG